MSKSINVLPYLEPNSARSYQGHATYDVVLDVNAGKEHRYTVLLDTSSDPVVVGRELPLVDCQVVIQRLEAAFAKSSSPYMGDRKHALRVLRRTRARQ